MATSTGDSVIGRVKSFAGPYLDPVHERSLAAIQRYKDSERAPFILMSPYLLFMLGEYASIVLMCALTTILFLGGWLPPFEVAPFTWIPGVVWFTIKTVAVFFMFAIVKAYVPRYRYDQLMRLGWKVFLPISLFMVAAVAGVLQLTGWAP